MTSWQIKGETMKQWETLFWGAQKSLQMVTAVMKLRHLLLWRKAMTNLDSVLKSSDITFVTKVCIVKAMVFPVVMYACESWTIKKAECQRTDGFELWCWRRLLRVPWTARKSNQSILKEISLEYSLEELMLKLQYFSHLMWKTDSFEKTLMLGKIEGRRRRKWQRMRWLEGITDWLNGHEFEQAPWWTGKPGLLQSMGLQRVRHNWVTELNWTPGGAAVQNLPANAGDTTEAGSIPGSGRSPGVGNGNPLQYPCLRNSMDRRAWAATA